MRLFEGMVEESVSEALRLLPAAVSDPELDLRCALHAARRALAIFSSLFRAVIKEDRSIAATSDILVSVSKS